MINFIELCESVFNDLDLLEEADPIQLRNLAFEARKYKRMHTDAVAKNLTQQKQEALNKLKEFQQTLKREYNPNLSDEQFEEIVKKSSFYLYSKGPNTPKDDSGGLIFLTPTYIKRLEQM
jgi:hypothetical protein